jgi:hypothetical protein
LRLATAATLLAVVAFIASLEASPLPVPLAGGVPDLEGFGLVIVYSSSSSAQEVIANAIREGVNVLVIVDSAEGVVPEGTRVVAYNRSADIALVRVGRQGVSHITIHDANPLYVLEVSSVEILSRIRGLGFPLQTPAAGTTGLRLAYLEVSIADVILAYTGLGLVEHLQAEGVIEDLAEGKPILWLPREEYTGIIGVFHPATMLWFLVGAVDALRSELTRSSYVVSLLLLALGLALAGLLPAFSVLAEAVEKRYSKPTRRGRLVARWIRRGLGS